MQATSLFCYVLIFMQSSILSVAVDGQVGYLAPDMRVHRGAGARRGLHGDLRDAAEERGGSGTFTAYHRKPTKRSSLADGVPSDLPRKGPAKLSPVQRGYRNSSPQRSMSPNAKMYLRGLTSVCRIRCFDCSRVMEPKEFSCRRLQTYIRALVQYND